MSLLGSIVSLQASLLKVKIEALKEDNEELVSFITKVYQETEDILKTELGGCNSVRAKK
jgi:hypothetical protein